MGKGSTHILALLPVWWVNTHFNSSPFPDWTMEDLSESSSSLFPASCSTRTTACSNTPPWAPTQYRSANMHWILTMPYYGETTPTLFNSLFFFYRLRPFHYGANFIEEWMHPVLAVVLYLKEKYSEASDKWHHERGITCLQRTSWKYTHALYVK